MTDLPSRRSFLKCAAMLAGVPSRHASATPPPASFPRLRRRVLGRTGLEVTELGMGSEAVSDIAVLRRALDLGVNFFDTARAYQGGNNERFLREALGSRRKDVVLSTRSYAKDARTLAFDLDASLQALGVSEVDIWYIGNKSAPAEVTDEMLEVQRRAQQAGKVRFRGLSTHRLGDMLDVVLVRGRFDVVQIPYNFAIGTRRDPLKKEVPGRLESLRRHLGWADTSLEAHVAQVAEAGVGVVAMKVMAGGYGGRAENDPLYGNFKQEGAHGAALRWALRNAHVKTTSVRMLDLDQLEENVRAMASPFSEKDGRLLASRRGIISPWYCRMCGGCEGACPEGLDVETLVRSVTYADGYGSFEMGFDRWSQVQPARRNVSCDQCSACAVDCPNGVRIRDQLLRARSLFA